MYKASIVGSGAIGSSIAARCQQGGLCCETWGRAESLEPLSYGHLNGELSQIVPVRPSDTDFLVLPVKAFQVMPALEQYRPFLKKSTCILLLHNGIGTEAAVLAHYPDNPILRLTTSIAAQKITAQQVKETGTGSTQAGWLRPASEPQRQRVENWCNRVFEPCHWFADIRVPLWQKLAVNSVINPLTAIYNVRNGGLASPKFARQIVQLVEEFVQIAKAEGLLFSSADILNTVYEVIDLTAQNYSSMHQDVKHNRKTEIDYINGHLVKLAAQHHIDAVVNRQLTMKLTSLEKSTRDW